MGHSQGALHRSKQLQLLLLLQQQRQQLLAQHSRHLVPGSRVRRCDLALSQAAALLQATAPATQGQ
jgi:hypothetical protein